LRDNQERFRRYFERKEGKGCGKRENVTCPESQFSLKGIRAAMDGWSDNDSEQTHAWILVICKNEALMIAFVDANVADTLSYFSKLRLCI